MTRQCLAAFFAGMSLGAPLALLLLYFQARIFCWRRRRQAQREAKKLAEIRIADERKRQSDLMAVIARLECEVKAEDAYALAQRSPLSGPFAVEARDAREMCLVFRTALIELRSKDRRRFFPLMFNGGDN
jgi:C4-dicarboxylate-specific signal transduction histidine kinase